MSKLKIEVGGHYRLKRSKIEVVCTWIEPVPTNVPATGQRLAEFEYFKKNMAYEEVPLFFPESRWDEHLEERTFKA